MGKRKVDAATVQPRRSTRLKTDVTSKTGPDQAPSANIAEAEGLPQNPNESKTQTALPHPVSPEELSGATGSQATSVSSRKSTNKTPKPSGIYTTATITPKSSTNPQKNCLNPLSDVVEFEKVPTLVRIKTILGRMDMDVLEDGGKFLFDNLRYPKNPKEAKIEGILLDIARKRQEIQVDGNTTIKVALRNQVFTHDNGKLDVVVFEKLNVALPESMNVLHPGRTVALIELKTEENMSLDSLLLQGGGYTRTILGHHAGLKALTLLFLSERSYYVGIVYWEDNYATLKAVICTTKFSLVGKNANTVWSEADINSSASESKPKKVLTAAERCSWNRFHYLMFHPA